jgi:hypothetical protein
MEKRSPKSWTTSVIFKMPKETNRPKNENSPTLVTLNVTQKRKQKEKHKTKEDDWEKFIQREKKSDENRGRKICMHLKEEVVEQSKWKE